MKLYPQEIEAAELYQERELRGFPYLSQFQLNRIHGESRKYFGWSVRHPYLHNAITSCIFLLLFFLDYLILAKLTLIFQWAPIPIWLMVVFCSFLHGIISYQVNIFSIHEGGAHHRLIQSKGVLSRILAVVAESACRVFGGDPTYYGANHSFHHSKLGTTGDVTFTNFVMPKRLFKSLLPLAIFLGFNDFRVHQGTKYDGSRILTTVIAILYHGAYFFLMLPAIGWLATTLILFVLGPWVGFGLDRLREGTEHDLMPLDTWNGTRDLGLNFWGFFIGGGPWGQPCHLAHHLAPHLPWYSQIKLHLFLKKILTEKQKHFFLVAPFQSFPALLSFLLKKGHQYLKEIERVPYERRICS